MRFPGQRRTHFTVGWPFEVAAGRIEGMDTVTRNVGDIDVRDRQTLEHLFGLRLLDNQQLVIQVVDLPVAPAAPAMVAPQTGNPVLPA